MIYRHIDLKSNIIDQANTEILFEIASARADGIELLRLTIRYGLWEESITDPEKIDKKIIKLLKNSKQSGKIQFFITKDDLLSSQTEVVFLLNKYPFIANETPVNKDEGVDFYIKI